MINFDKVKILTSHEITSKRIKTDKGLYESCLERIHRSELSINPRLTAQPITSQVREIIAVSGKRLNLVIVKTSRNSDRKTM